MDPNRFVGTFRGGFAASKEGLSARNPRPPRGFAVRRRFAEPARGVAPDRAEVAGAHEQREMGAGGAKRPDVLRRGSDKPPRCEDLLGRRHLVVVRRHKADRRSHVGEIEGAAEPDELALGQLVRPEQVLDDLDVEGAGEVNRPGVPSLEARDQIGRRLLDLQHARDRVLFEAVGAPGAPHPPAADQPVAALHQRLDRLGWRTAGGGDDPRLRRVEIDGCPGEDEARHLATGTGRRTSGTASRPGKGRPASTASPSSSIATSSAAK